MSLISAEFLTLLLAALLLGAMAFFSLAVTPAVFASLPEDMARRLARRLFRIYYATGAALALLAALLGFWSVPGLMLAFVGIAFLFALLWLMPAINRNHDKGKAGDAAALAAFQGLHRASVALNLVQILIALAAFALLATRL